MRELAPNRPWRRRAVGGAVLLLGTALAGCGTSRPAALKLDVLGSRAATEPLTAAAMIGPAASEAPHEEAKGAPERQALYLETRGVVRVERERQGDVIIERRVLVDPTPDDEAAGDAGGGEPVLLVESRYKIDENGALVLSEEINHEENVEVVFDPPLVVLPASMAPGESFEQKLSMVVHPMGDRMRTRAAGPVMQRVTFEGIERISIPAGEFEAAKVVAVFEGWLNVAKVRNVTEEWIALEGAAAGAAPAPLPVLAERREEVQTVILVPSTKKRLLVLMKGREE